MASSPTVLAGQGLTALLLGVPAWTAMTGSYTNTWSDSGAGNVTGQYRLWPLRNEVEIIGSLAHVSITGSSAFFTVPAALFPATAQLVCFCINSTGAGSTNITVSAAGVLTLNALPAGTTSVQFRGDYSLDA